MANTMPRALTEGKNEGKKDVLILVGVVFVEVYLAVLGLSESEASVRSVRHGVLLKQHHEAGRQDKTH
jgi:hypothetical protein